jgi:hypothetical protein
MVEQLGQPDHPVQARPQPGRHPGVQRIDGVLVVHEATIVTSSRPGSGDKAADGEFEEGMLVERPGAGCVTPPRNQRAPYGRFALAHYTDKDPGHDAGFRRQVEAFLASLGWAEPEIVEVLHAIEVRRQGIPRPFQDRSQDQGAVLGPARPDPLTDREDAYPG